MPPKETQRPSPVKIVFELFFALVVVSILAASFFGKWSEWPLSASAALCGFCGAVALWYLFQK